MRVLSLIGALLLPGAVAEGPPPPVSRWVLQDDPARCLLERRNVVPPATLSIETAPGSDDYRVAIAAENVDGPTSLVRATLKFDPSMKSLDGRARVVRLPNKMRAVVMSGVGSDLLDAIDGTTLVTLATVSGVGGSVPVSRTSGAIKALRECVAAQLIDWGADAAQFAAGGTTPLATRDRDEWITSSEHLKIAGQSKLSELNALFRVTVSTDGTIDGCRAVGEGVETGVAEVACAAVVGKRFFTAAKGPDGSPLQGVATFRVLLSRGPA